MLSTSTRRTAPHNPDESGDALKRRLGADLKWIVAHRRWVTSVVRPLKYFTKDMRMKLYPDDWRVRLTGAAGALVAGVIALFIVKPMIELPVWLGGFAFVGMMTVGVILGNIVGGWLFKPLSSSPPKHPPRA